MNAADLTAAVKSLARQAGFARVGIAPAGQVQHAEKLRRWLARGWHAGMAYMARHQAQRTRPDLLVAGARSVICLAVGYAPPPDAPTGRIGVARYARGRDYHKLLKRRCRVLTAGIGRIEPSFRGRAFVDSAPVMERSLAAAAGLGWIGRNGCLIVPGLGSYVVLAEVVCNLPLRCDGPLEDGCGRCDRCVRACPTGALGADALVDARICISYLTVEHRGPIEARLWPKMGTGVFGCDACQADCPHNQDVPAGDGELLDAPAPVGGASLADLLAAGENDWDAATRASAVRRVKWPALLRNAVIAAGNVSAADPAGADTRALAAALRRIRKNHAGLSELADWALKRLKRPDA